MKIHFGKLLSILVLGAGLLAASAIVSAQSAQNATLLLQKDSNELFTIKIYDPDGIKEFLLEPVNRFPYGGAVSGCPRSFEINNVKLADPDDFTPSMPASISDCKGNLAKFQVAPPKSGSAKGTPVTPAAQEKTVSAPVASESVEDGAAPSDKKQLAGVNYPIPELGGCESEAACLAYCDDSAHAQECLAFAKKHKLLSDEELNRAEKFAKIGKGPGGCTSEKSCHAYCASVNHIDECLAFAEENGFMPASELAEAQKIQAHLNSGRKLPGGCTGKENCELYCSNPSNMDECVAFAEEAGFLPPEELAQARKFIGAMKRGETPGKCLSRESCENYCQAEEHLDECIAFAEANDLLPAEDRELIKKTGGRGPGGCRGKAQCDAYCRDRGEECFLWAKEKGVISESEIRQIERGFNQFREQLKQMPPEVAQCFQDAVGPENYQKILNGESVFDRSLEGKIKQCFSHISENVNRQFHQLPPEALECVKESLGAEKAEKLFSGNFEGFNFDQQDNEKLQACVRESMESAPRGGEDSEGHNLGGPGGCRTPEECQAFCQKSPEACRGFGPGSGVVPQEEYQKQYEEQYRQEYEKQPQEQYPQSAPTSSTAPSVDQQYQQEYQKQYEEQYRQQYEQQYQNYPAPTNNTVPPSSSNYQGSFFSNLFLILSGALE